MSLTVTSREGPVGAFTVQPAGSLDSETSGVLERQLGLLLEASPKAVVLDLKDLAYISSAGVRVVLAAKKALKGKKADLFLANPQPQIRKVLEIIRAAPGLDIFESVEELDRYLAEMQAQVVRKGE